MRKKQKLQLLTSLVTAGCIFGSIAVASAETVTPESESSITAVSASTLIPAKESNYIAISVSEAQLDKEFKNAFGRPNWNVDVTETTKDGYTYTLRQLTLPDRDKDVSKYYWVRDGYNITAISQRRFEEAHTPFQLDSYATSPNVDKKDLVFTSRCGITDTSDHTVINNDTLHLLTYQQYGGATNIGGTKTPKSWHYFIYSNGDWVDVGGENIEKNSAVVTMNNATGHYQYKGKNIPFEYVYFLSDKDSNTDKKGEARVFLNKDGSVYTDPVYGRYNEILITAYNENTNSWSSVWGTQITDPNSTIGSMTMKDFNNILDDIHNEDVILSNADVKTSVAQSTGTDSGAFYLKNKIDNVVPGITVAASGGTGGADRQITFADTENGTFSLTTGSIVTAKNVTDGKLTALSINGTDYLLGGAGTSAAPTEVKAGSNVSVSQNGNAYTVSATDTTLDKIVKSSTDTANAYTISDTSGKTVTIDDVASSSYVDQNFQAINNKFDTGWTAQVNGTTVKTLTPDNNTLNFVKGDNVTLTNDNGNIKISATDKNTFTESAALDNTTLTFTRNDGSSYNVNLATLAGGSSIGDYRLVTNTNNTAYTVENGKVTLKVTNESESYDVVIDDVASAQKVNTLSSRVTVNEINTDTNTTNITNLTNTVNKGLNYTLDGTNSQNVQLGNTQNIVTGDNMALSLDENGLTVATKQDVSFSTVKVGNNIALSSSGINMGSQKITNLAAGTADTDAVTVSQLKQAANASKTELTSTGKNINVSHTTGTDGHSIYTVNLDDTINVTTVNAIAITDGQVVMTNGSITGLNEGTAATDAVNVRQLKKVASASKTELASEGENINVSHTVAEDGHSIYTVNLDKDITVNSVTSNLFTDGQAVLSEGQLISTKYALMNDGSARFADGAVSITDDGTFHAGETNFTVYADGSFTDTHNGENRIISDKKGVSLSKGNSQAVVDESGINLTKKDNRLSVTDNGTSFTNGANGFTNINGSIISAVGDTHAVYINGQAGTVNGLSNTSWDADNYISGQSATENQLKQVYDQTMAEAKKHTTVSAGDNISVTETNVNGQKDYKVSLKNDIALDQGKITTGNIAIDGTTDSVTAGTVKIDGAAGTISGLTNTTWNGTAGDVSRTATEGQLQDLQTKVNNDITNVSARVTTLEGETIVGGTGNDDGTITLNKYNQSTTTITGLHDYALKEGNYKADKDGNVALTVKDRYSNGVYQATIEDVAGKKNLDALTSAVGADSKETVKESYSKTYYIQDKDTLIDADVQLDKEIKQNRNQIVDNTQSIQKLNNGLNSLGNRMNKVGAGASALAALHPMDFDPDDKLNFSAGVGNYAGSTAAAIGAFYRPNERVMFSLGGTVGNGENMVNAGVSFALGKGGKVNKTRVAMTHEITELRQQVAVLTAMFNQMASEAGYKLDTTADFPDVPENHWAYEYVAKLAGAGIIEGYPDGNFVGDRAMTRYEFAAMLFRALEKGVSIDERMLDEFEPELGRLHVERIKGEQNSRKKIERVRLNDKDADRDVYGSKINVGQTW